MDETSRASGRHPSIDEGYRAVVEGVGLFDRSDRLRIVVNGPDRAKFLHNLTTNEVKKLPVNQGREAFVTSPQGKILGFVTMHALKNRILVRADHLAGDLITPHFQKYGLFDDIQIEDQTSRTFELHVAGPRSSELLSSDVDIDREADDLAIELESVALTIIRERPTGRAGFTIIGPESVRDATVASLSRAGQGLGLVTLKAESFDALRIEAGTPVFGRDITEKNLPQELARDDRAISFVKGCYLGQETVARIDALGHVNQQLRGLRSVSPTGRLEAGWTIRLEGKQVGTLTSASFSPGWGTWLALGYLRDAALNATAALPVYDSSGNEVGGVIVAALPMLPPPDR